MSDTDFRSDSRSRPQDLTDKVQRAGEDVKQRASDAFDATSEAARKKADELGDAAKETASHAAGKTKERLREQQRAGADYAMRFAGNMRGAARAFEQDTPFAARSIELAADYIEDAAQQMRSNSLNDVMDGVKSFARQQPAAFLGLSVLAGFAVVRFLKASGGDSSDTQNFHTSQQFDRSTDPGPISRAEHGGHHDRR
jgi:hypothetical protein